VNGNRVGALLHDEEGREAEAVLAADHELTWRGRGHDRLAAVAGELLTLVHATREVTGLYS
jgi:hypothetical protein